VSDTSVLMRDHCWSRHELLLVDPSYWASIFPQNLNGSALSLLKSWADRERPVIVRSRRPSEHSDLVPVGVPLPPAVGKQRIALSILASAVIERQRLPSLASVRDTAAPAWQRTIDALCALGIRSAVTPAPIGSLLWQYRTGLKYLNERSDLDVLWHPHVGSDIAALVARIAVIEQTAAMRIDGEIVFADGSAVNWRELHLALNGSRTAQVLVKSIDGVKLTDVSKFLNLRRAA
jgi:phosphoribosyl-dephospho-CoA transferase